MSRRIQGSLAGLALGLWSAAWILVYRWMAFSNLMLEEWLQIDADDAGDASVRWSVRALLQWKIAALFLLALVPYSAFLFLLALFVVPFAVLNDRAISGERFRFVKPQWSGLMPFIAAITWVISALIVNFVPNLIAEASPAASLALTPLSSIACAMLLIVAAEAFVFRLTPSKALQAFLDSMQWRRIGSVIAIEARFMYLTAFLLVPVVLIVLFLWKDIPAAASALGYERSFPLFTRLFIRFTGVIGDNAFGVLAFAGMLFGCLTFGRYAWLTRAPLTDRADPSDRPAAIPAEA